MSQPTPARSRDPKQSPKGVLRPREPWLDDASAGIELDNAGVFWVVYIIVTLVTTTDQ